MPIEMDKINSSLNPIIQYETVYLLKLIFIKIV